MAEPVNERDPLLPTPENRQAAQYGGDYDSSSHRGGNESDDDDTQDDCVTCGDASVQSSMISSLVENIEEFVEDVFDAATDLVHEVQEAVVVEFQEVKDALVDELHAADDLEEKSFLLEMNLTRNLSLLPVDAVEASNVLDVKETSAPIPNPDALKTKTEQDESEQGVLLPTIEEGQVLVASDLAILEVEAPPAPPPTTTHPLQPLSAYLLLASAVVSLSSIGPLLNFQTGVGSTMKVCWRIFATSIALFPFALKQMELPSWRKSGASSDDDILPRLAAFLPKCTVLLMTALAYTAMCVFFVWALEFTTVGNAVILSNSQALLLLLGKVLVGERISFWEGMGACVAFSGAILCSKDSAEAAASDNDNDGSAVGLLFSGAVLGDMFAIASAISGVAYLVMAKTVRSTMDLYVFMFWMMFLGSMWSIVAVYVAGEPFSFDLDTSHGMFGWMNLSLNRLPTELAMVVVCNLLGAMGYVRAMHFFDNLVISVATLAEPIVAQLLAFAIGVGGLPGPEGWLGNILVILGTFAVVSQPSSDSGKTLH